MATHIDYYLSLVSPFTYLGHGRFEELARQYGAEVSYRPADLLAVFEETGGLPVPKRSPQRQAYRMQELKRWRDYLGLPMNVQPRHFPVPDAEAGKVVIAAGQAGQHPGALIGNFLRAVWEQERDISDADTIRAIVTETGLDADALLQAAQSPEVAAERDRNTREAIERGVFGAPTWVIGEELFWGQDRLDFLERALAAG